MDTTRIGGFLLYGSIPSAIAYLYIFTRTIAGLSAADQEKLRSFRPIPAWRRFLGLVPFPLFFLTSSVPLRIVLALWFVAQLYLDARVYNRALETAGFPAGFCQRMSGISVISAIGTAMFVVGLVLR